MRSLYTQSSAESVCSCALAGFPHTLHPGQLSALQALLCALFEQSAETFTHSFRVAERTLQLDRAVRANLAALAEIDPKFAESVRAGSCYGIDALSPDELLLGALLHDIGKLCIPESVLNKPGHLTADERAVIERHVNFGEVILLDCPELAPALPIVSCHHERWDGIGYPYGYEGRTIPLGARMLAICDTYDAIISTRVYREGAPAARAREVIRQEAGSQFDPFLAYVFLSIPPCELAVTMPDPAALPLAA